MKQTAEEPEDIPALFVEAWAKRDAEMIAGLFAEDCNFINVTGLWWENPEDIRKAHEFGFTKMFMDSKLALTRTKTTYLSPNIAFVHAQMDSAGQTDRTGKQVIHPRHNLFVFVSKKEKGRWLCYSAQNSEILAEAQTFERQKDGSYKAERYESQKLPGSNPDFDRNH